MWEELKASLKPAAFTIETVPKRLAKLKRDPWEDYDKVKQKLAKKYLTALKIDTD